MTATLMAGGDPAPRVGTELQEGGDDVGEALERRSTEWRLAAIVALIDGRARFEQHPHCGRVAVVGGQHDERVPALVGQIAGRAPHRFASRSKP